MIRLTLGIKIHHDTASKRRVNSEMVEKKLNDLRTIISSSLILMILLLFTPQATGEGAASMDSVQAKIDAGNARWIEAFSSADGKKLAELFDPEGMMLSSSGDVTKGREAIEARVTRWLDTVGPVLYTIETLRVWPVENDYFEAGSYTVSYTDPETGNIKDSGRYLVIWRSQPDGSLKIYRDVALPK